MCVGCPYSPQLLTFVSSWGLVRLPRYKAINGPCPKGSTQSVVQNANVLSRNLNYLGYITVLFITTRSGNSAIIEKHPPRSIAQISFYRCRLL
ncbi:hypothetical protein EG333_14480 [Pectobacterium versatile]|nr:hypothetical protein EG333_14480 [Pectobacterium versatile]